MLFAYNKTTSPLTLAAGNPAPTLAAASSAGALGAPNDVTSELRGLSDADFALIEAQRAAGAIHLEWTTLPEFSTASLGVSSAAAGAFLDEVINIYVDAAGSDNNPGTQAQPVATITRALAIANRVGWGKTCYVRFGLGTFAWPANYRMGLTPGPSVGVSAPLGLVGTFADQLGGTQTSTASTGANNVLNTGISSSFRTSAVASITAVAGSGLSRTMTVTGLNNLTSADVGKMFKFALASNPGNNGTFMLQSLVSATSANFYAPKCVVENTNLIYWQDSFEGASIVMTSGAANNQSRMVRDHGTEAAGSVLVAGVVTDGDTLVVPDGTNPATTFTWKNVPVAATDVLIGADNIANAKNLKDKINAQAPTALRVRAYSTAVSAVAAGSALVTLKNMLPGSSGNQTITKTGVWTPTITSFTGGVGAPTTTFSVDEPFSPAPAAGDTFKIQKPGTIFSIPGVAVISAPSQTMGMQAIKLDYTSTSASLVTTAAVAILFDRCEINMLTRNFTANNFSVVNAANPFGSIDPTGPFLSNSNRCFYHNGTVGIFNSRLLGRNMFRTCLVDNSLNGSSEFNLNFIDGKDTTIVLGKASTIQMAASASYFGRLNGSLLSTDTGILKFDAGSRTNNTGITQVDISNASNYGIDVIKDSYATLGAITGVGNAKAGLHFDYKGSGEIATTCAIVGELGETEFFHFTAPNNNYKNYTTIRTADANGEKGYPSPATDPTFAAYGCRLDAA